MRASVREVREVAEENVVSRSQSRESPPEAVCRATRGVEGRVATERLSGRRTGGACLSRAKADVRRKGAELPSLRSDKGGAVGE